MDTESLKGTIFDSNTIMNAYESVSYDELRKIVSYFICVVLYIISFNFLVKNDGTEYIVYVFIFIVNAIFPFIWLEDYYNFLTPKPTDPPSRKLLSFSRLYSVVFAIVLQFTSLFLVLLKNEKIRSIKNDLEDNNINKKEINNLHTTDSRTEKNDHWILTFFISIITVIWVLIGHTFSNNMFFARNYSSPFIEMFKWLLDQPWYILKMIDDSILSFFQSITSITPLIKSIIMYCLTFISVLCIFFVRIDTSSNSDHQFSFRNIKTPFSSHYENNMENYRNLMIFIFSGFLIGLSSIPMILLNVPTFVLYLIISIITILYLGLFFGFKEMILPTDISIRNSIFFLLCLVFSILGTPVVLGFLQIFTEVGMFDGIQLLFQTIINSRAVIMNSLNHGSLLSVWTSIISLLLLFGVFVIGYTNEWVLDDNSKYLNCFNIILICMGISLFFSLSANHNIFTNSFKIFKYILDFVLVFIAPVFLVVLSITQLRLSLNNYNKYKNMKKIIK